MRSLLFLIAIALFAVSCNHPAHHSGEAAKSQVPSTGSYGESPDLQNAVPATQLSGLFQESDTAEVIISGDISASCKHSGCWMDIDMGNGSAVHVTFKDEKFTIPLDAAGKKSIAQGIAIRELIPLETLKNYAREDGKSEEEVALITEPAWNYEIIAEGVLIEE